MTSRLTKPKLKSPTFSQSDAIASKTLTSDFMPSSTSRKETIPKIRIPNSRVTFTDFKEMPTSYGPTATNSIIDTDRGSPPLILPFSLASHTKIPGISPKSTKHLKTNSVQFPKAGSLAPSTINTNTKERLSIRIPDDQRPLKAMTFRGPENYGLITERSEQSTEGFDGLPMIQHPHTVRHSPKARGHHSTQSSCFRTSSAFRLTTEDLEGLEESVYIKNPEITEKGTKIYKEKVGALNLADARKSQFGSRMLRREFLQNESTFLTHVPLLKSRQHSQMISLRVDDEAFFKKAAEIFNEGAKELEYENITSEEEKEVKEEQLNLIQLDKLRFIYCYINVKGKSCPLTITLLCPRDMKKVKVCVSMVQKKPTKLNCDTEFETRLFRLYDKDKMATKFSNSYFYFAFFADAGGTVSIKAEFNQAAEYSSKDNRKKLNPLRQTSKKRIAQSDYFGSLNKHEIEYEISLIKKERKEKMLQLSAGVNKIQLNKNTEQYTPYKAFEKRQALRQKSEDLLFTARSRKEVLDQQKFDARYSSMMKHDIQKTVKEIVIEENRKLMVTKFCIQQWFMNIFITNLGQSVKTILKQQKERKAREAKMKQVLSHFSRKVKKGLQMKAPEVEQRMWIDVRLALQLQAHVFRRHKMIAVEKVLSSFLQDTINVRFIQNKLLNTVQAIRKAQGTWRGYTDRKEIFKNLLLHLWERNFVKVFDEVMHTQASQSKQSGKKPNPIEIKANETAIKRFIRKWFKECVSIYRRNYDIHHSEVFKLSAEAKKQLAFQNLFREKKEAEQEEIMKTKSRKNALLMLRDELERRKAVRVDYASKDMTVEEKLIPPKLFILPNQEQLDNLIKEVIIIQIAPAK